MKVLIFFVYDHGFYGDRYGRDPTWTLRRETIVGIVKIRKEMHLFIHLLL